MPFKQLGRVSGFKGKKHTPEWSAKMREKLKGKKPKNIVAGWNKGLKMSDAMREKCRQRELGKKREKAHHWKGGITSASRLIRTSQEYCDWRLAVFTRDNFTCQNCGLIGSGNLEAHHLKPIREHPELATEITNGVTLCVECHELVDKFRQRFKGGKQDGKTKI